MDNKLAKTKWYLITVIGMAGWGALFPLLELISKQISPVIISLVRYVIAAISLFVICKWLNTNLKIKRTDILPIATIGILGTTLTTILIAWGISYSTVIHSSILVNSNPLLVGLVAPLFISEQTNWSKILGGILGLTGVSLAVLNGQAVVQFIDTSFAFGALLLFAAAVLQATYAIFVKKYIKKYNALSITLYAMFFGVLFLIPFLFFSGNIETLSVITHFQWIVLLAIGIVATVLPLLSFSFGIKHIGAISASSFKFTIPIFATTFAIIFFNESLTIWITCGIILTCTGIYLTERKIKNE